MKWTTHPLDGGVDRDRDVLAEAGSETGAEPGLIVVPRIAERGLLGARVHALVGDPAVGMISSFNQLLPL